MSGADEERAFNQAHALRYAHDVWTDHIPKWEEHVVPRFAGRADIKALEIGSLEGRSAVWILRHVLTGPGASLTCVDMFDVPIVERNFDYNTKAAGVADRVIKEKGTSSSVLARLPPLSFDLIYVDAAHDAAGVLMDTVQAWRLLKSGGLIVFDDYLLPIYTSYGKDGPKNGIDAFVSIFARFLSVIDQGWQMFVEKTA